MGWVGWGTGAGMGVTGIRMGCVGTGIGPETGTKDEVSPGKTRPLKATGCLIVGSVTVGLVTVGFGLLGRGCLNAIGEGDLSPGSGTLVARIGSFVGEGWRVGIGGLTDGKGLVLVLVNTAVGDGGNGVGSRSGGVGLALTPIGDRWDGRGDGSFVHMGVGWRIGGVGLALTKDSSRRVAVAVTIVAYFMGDLLKLTDFLHNL